MVRRGGSLNKEVKWRPWFSGTQGGGSLNKEVEWRQWFSGTQGGGNFKLRSRKETMVWWNARGEV